MVKIMNDVSRTFSEYLIVPGHSRDSGAPSKTVSLKTPLVKFRRGQKSALTLNIPLTSAVMQSVSGDRLAIALAREGGLSFIFGSQPIESQVNMVRKVKSFKAGFVPSDTNIKPSATLKDLLEIINETGHTTTAVTNDGTSNGKLLGIMASRDFRPGHTPLDTKISKLMTPREKLITASEEITLDQANDILWHEKLNTLPLVDAHDRMKYFVFRKDYNAHFNHPNELTDDNKRLLVGAGINTRDFETRIPALIEAGADVLVIDSSDGFSDRQVKVLQFVRKKYGDKVKIGAGNIVDAEGFRFLADAGADFIKIGIGGGSICITREQKGIGRGQASAVLDVAKARDEYYKKTGVYVPVCSDGGIVYDYHVTLALAMGADFLMLGRYFARFDESPTNKLLVDGKYVKEYWGEGSTRARNWQRYDHGNTKHGLEFEEGVDSYVPYAGSLHDGVSTTLTKTVATMRNCGVWTIPELQKEAKLTTISPASIAEGGVHDVIKKG